MDIYRITVFTLEFNSKLVILILLRILCIIFPDLFFYIQIVVFI